MIGTVIATSAFASTASRVTQRLASAPRVTLRVVSVAKIGGSSTLTIRGTARCKTSAFVAFNVVALEPMVGSSVHGSLPLPGGRVPLCKPPSTSFKLVANQQGEKKKIALKKSTVRACFVIHTWRRHAALGLDAQCFTIRASH
jgi:hypothetical protein